MTLLPVPLTPLKCLLESTLAGRDQSRQTTRLSGWLAGSLLFPFQNTFNPHTAVLARTSAAQLPLLTHSPPRSSSDRAPTFTASSAAADAHLSAKDVESIPDAATTSGANDLDEDDLMDEDDSSGVSDDEDEVEDVTAPASPRVRDEEDSEDEGVAPMRGLGGGMGRSAGGIGYSSRMAHSINGFSQGDGVSNAIPSSRPPGGGLGSSSFASRTTGIGFNASSSSSSSSSNAIPPPDVLASVPTSFGARPKPQTASRFRRPPSPQRVPSPAQVDLTAADRQAFKKMEGSFGARMLAKQGWQAGTSTLR